MDLNNKQIENLDVLRRNNVDYVIFGGHAAIFHGVNRETKDLDILTNNDESSAASLCNALIELIGPHPNLIPENIVGQKRQINLEEHGLSLEVLTAIDAIPFNEALANSIETKAGY